ncbi:MAG: CoB--CoM heterodisulfide reductase iron-sulfur subunit B family protein [Planctomycetaceae bacterium]|nr:CoB--CoM heterodisulfide reductase iron-sulfur subunit B family protein [Planctomycetota bacterium]NUN53015.1 CoB--CoM heterodisulfide reductase iron-sulfur subunit B family protein [Planctomycetaceae bacterium]
MRYGLFYGCAVPSRLPFIEKATAFVLGKLGIEAAPIVDATCCMDPIVLKSLSVDAWLASSARNIALAQEQGFDAVLTLCNGCFCSLNETAGMLEEDKTLLAKVDGALRGIGRSYRGGMTVKHLTQVLEGIDPSDLAKRLVRPLAGAKVAAFHGCHLVRPAKYAKVDDPVRPTILDRLVDRLGGVPVEYSERNECCGMGFTGTAPESAAERMGPILRAMESAGASFVVTPCPSCFLQIEGAQRTAGLAFPLPVLHVAEMYARAFGMDGKEMGLGYHRVRFAEEGVTV